jgi:hypothetical protein
VTIEESLVEILKRHDKICYYPSSGTDLSDLDYFGSGRKPSEERVNTNSVHEGSQRLSETDDSPDLFIHTDVNFYMEFAAGLDFQPDECGINGDFEILEFKELAAIQNANLIFKGGADAGRCFEYKLRVWNSPRILTVIFCLVENEYFVSKILLANNIKVPLIWSRNWNGSKTCGTWLANVLDRLGTSKVYTDWLCIPGKRGEPSNKAVRENYPDLMAQTKVKLVRNDDVRWIEEGSHGWVEEFDVVRQL